MDGVAGILDGRITYIKAPSRDQVADSSEVAALVADVLRDVRAHGDEAVRKYAAEAPVVGSPLAV